MNQSKRPFILLLFSVLLLTGVFTAPPAKAADSVWYKVYSWNGSALSSLNSHFFISGLCFGFGKTP